MANVAKAPAAVAARRAPGPPPPSLVWGHLGSFAADPLGFTQSLGERYPEVARLRFVQLPAYFFVQPPAVRRILVDNHTNYDKQMYDYQMLRRLLGRGLVTNDGAPWLKQRRLIQPAFSRRRLAGYAEIMQHCVVEMTEQWRRRDGTIIDVAQEMMQVTLRIVGLALFSRDLLGDASTIGEELTHAQRLLTRRIFAGYPPFLPGPLDWKLWRSSRRLRSGIAKIAGERRSSEGEPADLLDVLKAAGAESQMSLRQMQDEIVTLVSAGHETTANMLSWTFHLLGQSPEALAALRRDLDRLPRRGPIEPRALERAPYVTMALQESMRLRPPVWSLGRRAKARDVVMGYEVPAGSLVFVSQYVTHRHSSLWADALEFRPERFAADAADTIEPYSYFPFGGGPRLCIGQDFAMLEAGLILAQILRDFDLEPLNDAVEAEPLITLRPRNGLRMRLHVRS